MTDKEATKEDSGEGSREFWWNAANDLGVIVARQKHDLEELRREVGALLVLIGPPFFTCHACGKQTDDIVSVHRHKHVCNESYIGPPLEEQRAKVVALLLEQKTRDA